MRHLSTLLILLSVNIRLIAQSVGVNLPAGTAANTMLDVNGGVSFREGTALACANGINNNIVLADYSFYRVTGPTAAFSITGFGNGTDGRVLTIINSSGQNLTLSHLTTSTTANQINTGGSAVVLPANGVATFIYNANLTKWIVSGTMGNTPNFSNITNGLLTDSLVVVNNGVPLKVRPVDFIETYAWGIDGNTGTTPPTTIGLTVGANKFVGTSDAQNFAIGTNSLTRMLLDQNGNAYGGGNSTAVDPSVSNSFAWGDANKVYGINSMAVGTTNVDSSKNAFVFGNNNVLGTGLGYTGSNRSNRGTLVGGGQNVVTGGETYNSIISGSQNTVSGSCFESIITGYLNTINASQKIVTNGQWNTLTSAHYSTVFGISNTTSSLYGLIQGASNTINASSDNSVALGQSNNITGVYGLALGQSNTVAGAYGSVLGGFGLKLGAYSFGYNGYTSSTNKPDISATTNVAYLGDVDLWLGNVNNTARALRFYSPNTSLSYAATAYYTSFKAGTQAANINYTLPLSAPSASNSALLSDASGNLSWSTLNSLSWSLTGNSSTVDGTHFIGTTTNIPLSIRVNNQKAGRLDHLLGNTMWGYQAGNIITTSNNNTGIGHQALFSNTSAWGNTAVGYQSLYANITGGKNTAVGDSSLRANTTGYSNTAAGYQSLALNTAGYQNTAFGQDALPNNSTGNNNTALGQATLVNNTMGNQNVAVGQAAAALNTTGSSNTAVGQSAAFTNLTGANNTALGSAALYLNTASNNTSIGQSSMYNNTTGASNTAMGVSAMNNIQTGSNNAAYGYQALVGSGTVASNTGSNNTAIGYQTLGGITSGANNTALGYQAGNSLTTGTFNIAIGSGAQVPTLTASNQLSIGNWIYGVNGEIGIGTSTPNEQLELTQSFRFPTTSSISTGVIFKDANSFIHNYKPVANDGNNTFLGISAGNFTMSSATSWLASGNTGVGSYALTALTTGGLNTAMGYNALLANTTGAYNVAIGSLALSANTTGSSNVAVGHNTLPSNTAGNNTALGGSVLFTNTTGALNTGVGESSLNKNTTGNQNTSVGQSSMRQNITGNNNTALGLSALQNNTAGSDNTALGHTALGATTGSGNVGVGENAGNVNTTGTNNTFVGFGANTSAIGLTNAMALGYNASVTVSNKIVIGNASATTVGGYSTWTNYSDGRFKKNVKEDVVGLGFILKLRPITYNLDVQGINKSLGINEPDTEGVAQKERVIQSGFIAQEVEAVAQKVNYSFSGVHPPQSKQDNYSLAYSDFVVPLVKAMQEQQALIDILTKENTALKAKAIELDALKAEVEKIKKAIGMETSAHR
jgi:trimeric autotransporter adhesin